MSINKNALLRYQTLDKCFSNFGRKYFINDLLNAVNEKLIEENYQSDGIQERQLRADIKFMRSDVGYTAPIETYRDGKKGYYRYSNKAFSINNSPLTETEKYQLKNAISILSRFEGNPQFEWLNELTPLLKRDFGLENEPRKIIEFDHGKQYSGNKWIPIVFDAIYNKRVIEVSYLTFNGVQYKYNLHPYYLKEYNNRWFLFGLNDYNGHPQWVAALDRMEGVNEIDFEYIDDVTDWNGYFKDVIGITKKESSLLIEVELLFTRAKAPYIETQPLHSSQISTKREDGSLHVKLNVIDNYELMQSIEGYGVDVEVLSPKSLRDEMKTRVQELNKIYKIK